MVDKFEEYKRKVDAQVATVSVSDWIYDSRVQPGETQVFVVGDVHGYAEQLDSLLWAMSIVGHSFARQHLILLGDLIDKGPDPAGTLHVLVRWFNRRGDASAHKGGFLHGAFDQDTLLLGNHDLFFHATASGDEKAFRIWRKNGARTLLDQIGATAPDEIRTKLVEMIGLQALQIYESGISYIEIGNLLFVHAGVSPSMSLAEVFSQDKMAWLQGKAGRQKHWAWIMNEFLSHEGKFDLLGDVRGRDRLIVHGHTAEAIVQHGKGRLLKDPLHQIDGWRLGLDGTRGPTPCIAGAEIWDGRYRLYTVPIPQEAILNSSHAWRN